MSEELVVPEPDRPLGLSLLAELERNGAVTEVSLRLPPGLPYDQYEALAAMFGQLHRTSQWLIGDLINYGEKADYGEKYVQAVELTGLAPQTLANYSSVCSRIPRSRRRSTVNFSIHAEVASKEPDEQKKWLKLAEENGWTRAQLRNQLDGIEIDQYQSVADDKKGAVVPDGQDHLCQCFKCGRLHRNDLDVTIDV